MRCVVCSFSYIQKKNQNFIMDSDIIRCCHPNRKHNVSIGTLKFCSKEGPRPVDCPIIKEDRALSKIKKLTSNKSYRRKK